MWFIAIELTKKYYKVNTINIFGYILTKKFKFSPYILKKINKIYYLIC